MCFKSNLDKQINAAATPAAVQTDTIKVDMFEKLIVQSSIQRILNRVWLSDVVFVITGKEFKLLN